MSNAVLADSHYGSTATKVAERGQLVRDNTPVEWAVSPFCSITRADGVACSARKAKGTEFCYGHLRARGEA